MIIYCISHPTAKYPTTKYVLPTNSPEEEESSSSPLDTFLKVLYAIAGVVGFIGLIARFDDCVKKNRAKNLSLGFTENGAVPTPTGSSTV